MDGMSKCVTSHNIESILGSSWSTPWHSHLADDNRRLVSSWVPEK